MQLRRRLAAILLAFLPGFALTTVFFVMTAWASSHATLTVDTLADGAGDCSTSGSCTLRAAIAAAAPGDTIVFAPALAGGTITLSSEQLTIDKSLTINGSNAITVSGGSKVRVFVVAAGTVTLDGLTIVDGKPAITGIGDGAGIRVLNSASLTVLNTTLAGNMAVNGGGGIANYGVLIVRNSTFFSNTTGGEGGAIYNNGSATISDSTLARNEGDRLGGGISNRTALTITNSTFYSNASYYIGGGIYNSAALEVKNSTLLDNAASDSGSGLYSSGGSSTLTVANTIIARSLNGGDCEVAFGGLLASANNNLIEATGSDACGLTNGINGNIIGSDPLLGALADNGGPTLTHLPQSGSPAIDAGDCTAGPAADQRGVARSQDDTCDIGAVEVAPQHELTVGRSGAGTGNIASTPAGITCGVTCTASFDVGTVVTLTATAESGSVFAGWAGACSGSGACTVVLSAGQTVTATFALYIPPTQPAQAQTMCYGAGIQISIEPQLGPAAATPGFDLVVITGDAPPNLFLTGDIQCIPYVGFAEMIELTNQLVTAGCPGGAACNAINRIVFDSTGAYRVDRITGVQTVYKLYLPVINAQCSAALIC
jgi:CSLREA domain-containing protein